MTDRPLHPSSRSIALACAAAVALAASWTLGLPALGARLEPSTVELVQGMCNTTLQLAGAAALFRGAARQTGRRRAAWMTMAAGASAGALGSAAWSWVLTTTGQHPTSAVIDGLYAVALLLATVGVAALPPSELRSRRVRTVDTAILIVTALTLVWVTPVHQQVDGRVIAGFPTINIVEVVTVLTILVAVGAVARCRPDRHGEVGLMSGALICSGIGMLLYASAPDGYPLASRLGDLVFTLGFVLVIAAGFRLCGPARPPRRRGSDLMRHWVALPEVATIVTLVAITVHERVDDTPLMSLLLGSAAVALAITRLLQLGVDQRGLSRSLHDSADQLYREARTDTLTGLGNRLAMDEHLGTRLEHQGRQPSDERESVAVLFVDIDHFKRFNDALGHSVGDGLLVEVARRVVQILGQHAYRIGGDEFVAVMDGVDAPATDALAADLILAFDEPVVVADHEMNASVSIGVAHWAADRDQSVPTAIALLRQADLALYRAKELGRARWAAFDPAVAARAEHRQQLRRGLQHAAEADELEVHFEPVARLRDHRTVGVTARLVWPSEQYGLLGPEVIGPVAVEGGLVATTTARLFDGVRSALIRTADTTTDAAGSPLWVGVRLSREELLHPAVSDLISSWVQLPGGDASRLHIDLTEDTVLDDAALERMAGLRRMGVHMTVEQFGTGPSSLMRLSRYPAAAIRVDGSFIEGLGRRRDDTVIVTAVAGLSTELGLELSADGIDEEFQATYLEGLGFTTGRGRLFDHDLAGLTPFDAHRGVPDSVGASR